MNARTQSRLAEGLRLLCLSVVSLLIFFPFAWMIISAFKSAGEVLDKNVFLPTQWHPENFIIAWGRSPFGVYFRNSLLMSATVVLMQMITSSLAAFAFAKLKFRLSKPLFFLFLCSMMIPQEATIISNYLLISDMMLADTFLAVVMPSFVSVFGVFLLRQFYMTIPDALIESARIDGATDLKTFFRIILPLGKSALATIAIIGFINNWNSYLWPMIITNSMELRTVQTGLRSMLDVDLGIQWQEILAMSTIITIPVLALFVCLQKYFVQGITKVGIK